MNKKEKINKVGQEILDTAIKFNEYKNNTEKFLKVISNLDEKYLEKLKDYYSGREKINLIRYKLVEQLLNKEVIDMRDLKRIKDNIAKNYKKNILHSWKDFNILFTIYYNDIKDDIRNKLNLIAEYIKNYLKNHFNENNNYVVQDFLWNQNFGTDNSWIAFYPIGMNDFKDSVQLYLRLEKDNFVFGLNSGSKVENIEKDLKKDINFDIDNICDKYVEVYDKYDKFNSEILENQESDDIPETIKDYTKKDALKDLFISEDKINNIIRLLKYKKNIILQGPPGVGKTFIAKRLAYTLLGEKKDYNIETIQFHQSYSYEDFIQGYRPTEDGNFKLENGIFYHLCEKAKNNSDEKYFIIIDEINRGNLSKIFGELMMLIEKDKRGKEYKLNLTYEDNLKEFYIPENIYLIGTMNTADRSLAMVDYALRRRFSFINLEPKFNDKFKNFLSNKGVKQKVIDEIVDNMHEVNKKIEADKKNLGKGYKIGHSYFCPDGERDSYDEEWYNTIIKNEIIPLLEEYWFDKLDKVKEISRDIKIQK